MLRFYTTSSPFNLTTIQDYVNRMRPAQNHIFFLCERSIQAALQSPYLEHFHGQHVEVILLTDLVDEYMMEVWMLSVEAHVSTVAKETCAFMLLDDWKAAAFLHTLSSHYV